MLCFQLGEALQVQDSITAQLNSLNGTLQQLRERLDTQISADVNTTQALMTGAEDVVNNGTDSINNTRTYVTDANLQLTGKEGW